MITLTLSEQIELLKTKKMSSKELTLSYINQIDSHNKHINALISFDEENALAQAEIADKRINEGSSEALTGIPIIHKDNLCTTAFMTTAGSRILKDFIPPYNAHVVQKTLDQNMVVLGKASCDEFAMGSTNETSYYGNVLNPYSYKHVPGGSSGGSAASVAANFAPLATGSDTGGSVRQPASYCNLTGLKPTYGLVSRFGLIAFASSLDQVGPMARSALDCAYLMDVISGYDPKDSTSIANTSISFVDDVLSTHKKSLRIGIPKQLETIKFDAAVERVFQETIKRLEAMGHTITTVDLNTLKYAVPAYYVIAPAEASSNLARYNGSLYGYRAKSDTLSQMYKKTRTEGFGSEVKRRVMIGSFVLSKGFQGQYYEKALNVKKLFASEFNALFQTVDFMLTPTTSSKPLTFNHFSDPVKLYETDALTIPANLVGLPAVSFQGGFENNLPIGMQLIGNHLSDAQLLKIVHDFQQETDFHLQQPQMN